MKTAYVELVNGSKIYLEEKDADNIRRSFDRQIDRVTRLACGGFLRTSAIVYFGYEEDKKVVLDFGETKVVVKPAPKPKVDTPEPKKVAKPKPTLEDLENEAMKDTKNK